MLMPNKKMKKLNKNVFENKAWTPYIAFSNILSVFKQNIDTTKQRKGKQNNTKWKQ